MFRFFFCFFFILNFVFLQQGAYANTSIDSLDTGYNSVGQSGHNFEITKIQNNNNVLFTQGELGSGSNISYTSLSYKSGHNNTGFNVGLYSGEHIVKHFTGGFYGFNKERGGIDEFNSGDIEIDTFSVYGTGYGTGTKNTSIGSGKYEVGYSTGIHKVDFLSNEFSQENNNTTVGVFDNITGLGNSLRILEIYPKDSKDNEGNVILYEYIVIKAIKNYVGSISVAGLGGGGKLGGIKKFNINLVAGETIVITDGTGSLDIQSQNVIVLSSITLTDSGEELQIFDETGNLLDYVTYSSQNQGSEHGFSRYYKKESDGKRYFDKKDMYSVFLSEYNNPSCVLDVDLVYSSGDITQYTINPYEIDEKYCSTSLYKKQRKLDDVVVGGDACSLSIGISSGLYNISFNILQGKNLLCTSSLSLYTHSYFSSGSLCQDGGKPSSGLNHYYTGSWYISEIHPYDTDQFPEYIEIVAKDNISEEVTIQGLGHGSSSKSFFLHLYSGQRIIISDGTGGFSSYASLLLLPSISLTDHGETLTGFGQSGQVIDIYHYGSGVYGKSLVRSDVYTGIGGIGFFVQQVPTPGFDYEQIAYLFDKKNAVDNNIECSIRLQNKNSFLLGKKVNIIAVVNGKEIQNNSSKYECNRRFPGSSYVFTGGCNPGYFEYDDAGIYTIVLDVLQSGEKKCSTSMDINYPEVTENKSSGGSCRQTYYQNLYKKRKGRFLLLKKDIKELGYGVTSSGHVYKKHSGSKSLNRISTGGVLSIYGVLPNPSGKDTGNERIIIKNMTNNDVSFTGLFIFNGTSKKKITQKGKVVFAPLGTGEFVGSLGLKNKASCVSLYDDVFLYDTFCYPKAGNDERFFESLNIKNDGVFSVLGKLSLREYDNEFCIEFEKEKILCKKQKYLKEQIKERKLQAKQFVRLEKKMEKNKIKRDKKEKRYKDRIDIIKKKLDDEKEKRKKMRKKIKKSLDDIKRKYEKQKHLRVWYQKQLRLAQGFIDLTIRDIKENRTPVYTNSLVKDYYRIYKYLLSQIKGKNYITEYMGMEIKSEDIKTLVQLEIDGVLPLSDIDIVDVYKDVFEKSSEYFHVFLKRLRISEDGL